MLQQRALAHHNCHPAIAALAATAVGHLGHAPGATSHRKNSLSIVVPNLQQAGVHASVRYPSSLPRQLTRALHSQASTDDVSALYGHLQCLG
jgi:hypothetical protein